MCVAVSAVSSNVIDVLILTGILANALADPA